MHMTGICSCTLAQLKISPRTTAVFKLQYEYQYVFYKNMIFLGRHKHIAGICKSSLGQLNTCLLGYP